MMSETKSDAPTASTPKRPRKPARSRFTPAPVAKIALTPRDVSLLCVLYQHSIMSRSQLQALYFNSTPCCNARLRKLFDAGFVTRPAIPVVPCAAPYGIEAIYALGKAGVPVVARHLELEMREVNQGYRRTLSPTFLEHTLEIVNLLLAFRRATHPHSAVRLDRWLPEMQCRDEYEVRAGNGPWRYDVFKPDAFVRLQREQGDCRNFFIEVDLGHTSSTQFLAKLHTHQRYLDSGRFGEQHGGERFKTLVVTTTEGRLQNLLKLVENTQLKLFWFTTFEQVQATAITGPIWHAPFVARPTGLV